MKIAAIELLSNDITGTTAFYEGLLGFKKIDAKQDTVSFRAGASVLTFLGADEPAYHYHFAFDIPNNKMEEAVTWMAQKTSLILNSDNAYVNHFESWNAKAFYFYDNNGNIVEFITRYDRDIVSDRPFSAERILTISEIGMVTEQPLLLAEKLIRENDLSWYTKGPKREDFAVIGEETGLLIIAREGRNWFPTESKAEKQYVKATITSRGIRKEIIINTLRS